MEVFKIKISPEVLRLDVTQQNYSGDSFGYYSGLTKYLSQTKTTELTYTRTSPTFPGGFLFLTGDFTAPEGYNDILLLINRFSATFEDNLTFFQTLQVGQRITVTSVNGTIYEFFLYDKILRNDEEIFFRVNLYYSNEQPFIEITDNDEAIFTIIQENMSTFEDMSIPVLLKQDYVDLGYYSPFDGDLSQFIDDVNFTFIANTVTPFEVCVFNTSNNNSSYLQEANYSISWGDSSPVENATIFIPETICHTYIDVGSPRTYEITLTGQTEIGSYIVTKSVTVPFTSTLSDDPYGTVTFLNNNGSWSETPQTQNYYNDYDSNNTVEYQISENFVDVPFILTGFTKSRLNDLASYGLQKFRNDVVINLSDGTTGVVTSQSPEFTAYTINDQSYIDFSGGTSIFVVESRGLTDNMIVATGITKLEYLMNVIDQPIIQSNVFIDRGKYSGLESFRRIGEIGNIGALRNYGYGFFDVKNYNDV
jgi:hypothetical protein